jgi:hypothetical protein
MMMKKNIFVLSLLGVMSIPLTASASLITGVLNFTGAANISLGSIAFVDNEFGITSPGFTQQGGFVPLAGTAGVIQNITDPPDATGPVNVPDFITFDDPLYSNISITLTYVFPGIDGAAGCFDTPPAANQECTPNLPDQSPVNLENLSATSSSATLEVLGLEEDSLTNTSIPIAGTFTAPFSSMNFQQILADVYGGGTITTSFSAEFNTNDVPSVPEPGTLLQLMIGAGVAGIGLVYRKRFAKA